MTDRALRGLEASYEFIEAETSEKALAWFNDLARAIYGLERFPERGALVPENKKLRQSSYRIIYAVDRRNRAVTVLHIRHGARSASTEE